MKGYDPIQTGYASLPHFIVRYRKNEMYIIAVPLSLNDRDGGRQLRRVTASEGIGEQRHIDFLRQVGYDKVQGSHFARPEPAESVWQEQGKNR